MPRLKPLHAIWAVALLVGLAMACSSSDGSDGQAGAADGAGDTRSGDVYTLKQQFQVSIDMSSTKFNETKRIPRDYSCDRDDVSPPIDWGDVPDGTVSLALVVDSDQVPGTPWVHWVLWGIPADAAGLPEGVPNTPKAPSVGATAGQGTNDDAKVGWSGPCPPPYTLAMPDGVPAARCQIEKRQVGQDLHVQALRTRYRNLARSGRHQGGPPASDGRTYPGRWRAGGRVRRQGRVAESSRMRPPRHPGSD